MPRSSPHTVTYKDLLAWAEKQLAYAKQRHSAALGVTNLEAITKDKACAETIVRMLKKGEPGRQTDMLELFNQVNK